MRILHKRFRTTINGKDYVITGEKSAQHMDVVIDLLKTQLEQLHHIDPTLDTIDRCILMAINAISDSLSRENRIKQLEEEIQAIKSQNGMNFK